MEPINAHYDGKVFVPDEPVSLNVNESVKLILVREGIPTGTTPLQRLLKVVERLPKETDGPSDLAAEHDHYLYGTPKRNDATPSAPS